MFDMTNIHAYINACVNYLNRSPNLNDEDMEAIETRQSQIYERLTEEELGFLKKLVLYSIRREKFNCACGCIVDSNELLGK